MRLTLLLLQGGRISASFGLKKPVSFNFTSTSLFVQLCRCMPLQGIKPLSPIRQQDLIGNLLHQTVVNGMQRLMVLGAETRQLLESHIHNAKELYER
jgi:hypothetical protein